jgi:hypothetical protein
MLEIPKCRRDTRNQTERCPGKVAAGTIETQIIIRGRETRFLAETWFLDTALFLNIYSKAPVIRHALKLEIDKLRLCVQHAK